MNTVEPQGELLDTLVVGAGISGLSLAHRLQQLRNSDQHPWQLLITEGQERVGGNITTGQAEGFLWEEGPTSFAPNPTLLKLVTEVGLESELILADRQLPRYIYWQGQLQPVPMSPPKLLSTRLLSSWGKLRALAGAVGFVKPMIGLDQDHEETVAQFFSRHLGSEVTQRLVAPFVSGVYAGDIHQLSAAAAFERVTQLATLGGGLLPGAIRSRLMHPKPTVDPSLPKTKPGELGSFRSGLQALPQAIASQFQQHLRLNWRVKSLQRTEQQTYLAEISTPEGLQQIAARSVVLTAPAYVTAELLRPLHPHVSQALAEFIYPPVACVVLAYPDAAFAAPLRGFGNLIPRQQGVRTLGTIWSSSLFPGRVPAGWQMLTNFIGGATDPEVASLSPAAIVQVVHQDLRQTLSIKDMQPQVLAVHLWPRAIPQYTLGHERRLQQIRQGLEAFPGVFLCSNYMGGIALGDRVQRGQETALQVHEYLQSLAATGVMALNV